MENNEQCSVANFQWESFFENIFANSYRTIVIPQWGMLSSMMIPMRSHAPRNHSSSNSPSKSPSWRERIAALRYVPPLIKLVWRTHRGYTAIMIALRLSLAFAPVATLWVGKLIIDAVVAA